MRFISVIKDYGRVWSDYLVIDTERGVVVAVCSMAGDAETIAACLNARAASVPVGPVALLNPKWDEEKGQQND